MNAVPSPNLFLQALVEGTESALSEQPLDELRELVALAWFKGNINVLRILRIVLDDDLDQANAHVNRVLQERIELLRIIEEQPVTH